MITRAALAAVLALAHVATPAPATPIRCAPDGAAHLEQVQKATYSVCAFEWGGKVVHVIAARYGDGTFLRPFGQRGLGRVPSSTLELSAAAVGTNGDFKAPGFTTNHLWIRAGRVVAPGTQRAVEFVETPDGAFVGREAGLIPAHPDAVDAFGGFPQVVTAGLNTGPADCPPGNCSPSCGPVNCDNPMYGHNPRTAVGVSAGCEDHVAATECVLYLVTVDGVAGSPTSGVTFPVLGQLMLALGSQDAMNTDGGGSTEMWSRNDHNPMCASQTAGGCLLDSPVYTERPVVQSIGLDIPVAA